MKKILSIVMLMSSLSWVSAQTMMDAIRISDVGHYGTARSMALGDAMTAVGGDVGSIWLNPAGSAVAVSDIFTVTPGLTISSTSAAYSTSAFSVLGSDSRYAATGEAFGPANRDVTGKLTMPNMGVVVRYGTEQNHGLKSVTFGLTLDQTGYNGSGSKVSALNGRSSMLGSFASLATFNSDGTGSINYPSCLDPGVDFGLDPYNNPAAGGSYYSWNVLSAYESYMIGYNGDNNYIGATQDATRGGSSPTSWGLKGDLNQMSSVITQGTKRDLVMNLGMNWDDTFFLGFNLGLPIASYSYNEFFRETPDDPEEFPTFDSNKFLGNLQSAQYQYDYLSNITGIYAKAGFIWLPVAGLRVGAAIQTPSIMTIEESWCVAADTEFNNLGKYEYHAGGPGVWGNYRYDLRTPYVLDAGVAYTFGPYGFVSVDYEMTDYSVMKFSYSDYYEDNFSYEDPFYAVNDLNSRFCGVSHNLKLGAEARLTPVFSLRAGYNVRTSPLRYYRGEDGEIVDADAYDADYDYYSRTKLTGRKSVDAPVRSFSLGCGFSSCGSFFLDAAVRLTSYPTTFFAPYSSYQYNSRGELAYAAPLISNQRRLWDMAITLGWRF